MAWNWQEQDIISYLEENCPEDLFAPSNEELGLDADGYPVAKHYGVKYKSGRYEYGSGENPFQHDPKILSIISDMKQAGMTETEIAGYFGMSTTDLRREVSLIRNENREYNRQKALEMLDTGMSKAAVAKELGIAPSTLNSLLNAESAEKQRIVNSTADVLKNYISANDGCYVDIGLGAENLMGVSQTKLRTAIHKLEEEGYVTHTIKVDQIGVDGAKTEIKVLCPPGTEWSEVVQNMDKIQVFGGSYTEDGGRTWAGIEKPQSVDGSRVMVRYGDQGGTDMDGVIQIRRGCEDLDLGDAHYAQVRVAVDEKYYLKGMAIYADDKNFPDGVDIIYNSNKDSSKYPDPHDVYKKMKLENENPFGANLRMEDGVIVGQSHYIGSDGEDHLSALNIVRQEGDWNTWSKNLASQMLSKQPVALAKGQLDEAYNDSKAEYDEIMKIECPEVRSSLLNEFAGKCDSAAVELKAAALPRQSYKVILPVPELKDNEVYAPTYRDGEEVVLIRYPHGGIFEIPRLIVNNRNSQGNEVVGKDAKDAIGINPKTAEQLSGADFDGDTVIIIPTSGYNIKNMAPLEGLKDFNPKMYQVDHPTITNQTKQIEMGKISNLITDMTIAGAPPEDLARAVRHSMVVIDSEKHHLDYKQSEKDNGIAELKEKYRGNSTAGASTLISRASSPTRVDERKEVLYPSTMTDEEKEKWYSGEKVYRETGRVESKYTSSAKNQLKKIADEYGKNSKEYKEAASKADLQDVKITQEVAKMSLVKDANELSSGTKMESVYANYANSMKALAATARKEARTAGSTTKNTKASVLYSQEVNSIKAKVDLALKNKPLERQAQILANKWYWDAFNKVKDTADAWDSEHQARYKGQYLQEARRRVGADKKGTRIVLTENEWKAVNSGAVTSNIISQIISNSDSSTLKQLANPRQEKTVTSAQQSRIRSLIARGYTIAEVADHMSLSTSTIEKYM